MFADDGSLYVYVDVPATIVIYNVNNVYTVWLMNLKSYNLLFLNK